MTGSDSDGEAPVSQADLATFPQEMANEVAQLQAVLTEAVKDMVDAARPSAPGGGRDGAGRFGSQHGSHAAGASLLGHGFPGSPAAGASSFAGGHVGGGTPGRQFGSPFAGVNLPTSGIAGHPVGGARGAYAGLPGLT